VNKGAHDVISSPPFFTFIRLPARFASLPLNPNPYLKNGSYRGLVERSINRLVSPQRTVMNDERFDLIERVIPQNKVSPKSQLFLSG